jgi:hypothetical protein
MRRALLVALFVCLASPGAAGAGGWATVKLESLPEGVQAGQAWVARITVMRHAVTPTDGARPSVTIRRTDGGKKTTFAARPTGKTGVYEARVVFPSAGTWRYEIDNGLVATGYGVSAKTTYPPVEVAGPGAAGGGSSLSPWYALLAAAVVLVLGGAGIAWRRRGAAKAPVPAV